MREMSLMVGLKVSWSDVAAAGLGPVIAIDQGHEAPLKKDAEWHNQQALYLLELKSEDDWRTTPSGLRYRRVKEGLGDARPSPTDTVTIHYTGTFIDGTEFDSSVPRGEPATFPPPNLIKGWPGSEDRPVGHECV